MHKQPLPKYYISLLPSLLQIQLALSRLLLPKEAPRKAREFPPHLFSLEVLGTLQRINHLQFVEVKFNEALSLPWTLGLQDECQHFPRRRALRGDVETESGKQVGVVLFCLLEDQMSHGRVVGNESVVRHEGEEFVLPSGEQQLGRQHLQLRRDEYFVL